MRKWAVVAAVLALMVLFSLPVGTAESDSNASHVLALRSWSAKYHDVKKAEADGFKMVSGMVPHMGYHYVNFGTKEFDPKKPNTLLYVKQGNGKMRLVGVEWSFPFPLPKDKIPFKGADVSVHEASCHYKDGSEYSEPKKDVCKKTSDTGSEFASWHPDLHTLHAYVWYPNSEGVFSTSNALLQPFSPKPKVAKGGGGGTLKAKPASVKQ